MTLRVRRPVPSVHAVVWPRPWPTVPSLGVAVVVLALLAALLVVMHAAAGPVTTADLWLLRQVQRVDLPGLQLLLAPVDALTSSVGAVGMWVLALVLLRCRWWPAVRVLLLMPAGGVVDNLAAMVLTPHDRPSVATVARVATGTDATSFPSGHVLGAVLLYGFLFVVADRVASPPLRRVVKATCVVVIATVGVARLWYGAHWPTDVLGGYAIGALLLLGLITFYRRSCPRNGRL